MAISLLEIPTILGFSIEVYLILLLISIPTFLFWRWAFKKTIRVDRRRIIFAWVATIIVTPVIYVGLITLFMIGLFYTPSKDFDRSLWRTDREGRFQMANDIIKSKMLIGKDTAQIKQLLGNPTWGGDSTNEWNYDMGFGGGGLGFLYHRLNLKLDTNKLVLSVEHIELRD
jgi:hypothetical protein